MNVNKASVLIMFGYLGLFAVAIGANAYNTKQTNDILKSAINKGANVTLKTGTKKETKAKTKKVSESTKRAQKAKKNEEE